MLSKKLLQFTMVAAICLLVASTESCTATKIVSKYDCADAAGIKHDTTVWHFFWGLVQKSDINPGCDPRFNHLNQVAAKTTFGTVAVSFLSLGMAIPQKMSWCCAPPKITTGEIPQ
ncbi:MAG TPA: hypothetical protein VLC98_13400 [Phnomibacter sp.]|nr:hypothetical protein [Phnomibacter sp.]